MRAQTRHTQPHHAVIYARVSGAKQVREGDGLSSQETRCREYAAYKSLDVARVFKDDMTGKLATRPGMQAMLAYLRKHKGTIVIIDDISRLARGLDAHLELRSALASAGAKLESPSIEFGEDSDSLLVENLLASVAQHHREKNGEQTRNRMRGRLLNGYWVFQAPIGLKYEKRPGHGKVLVRDEPLASIVQEGLEGYASGRFETQVEVKHFFDSQPLFPKELRDGTIRQQKVTDMLTRTVYAGYLEVPGWGIPLTKAQHEGLIDLKTFQRIQERRAGSAKAPTRKDIRADFPLRGFVTCADCGKPHTAAWSKSGTGKRHAYYACYTKGCPSYRKSIRKDAIEGAFVDQLTALTPSKPMIEVASAMFRDAWAQRQAQADQNAVTVQADLAKIDKQIEGLLDRIVESENATVIAAYEKRIIQLERDKTVLADQAENTTQPRHTFEEMFERALTFLANPSKLWESGNLALQRTVLKLAFAKQISYDRKTGLRTPQLSVPFTFLGPKDPKCKMVPPERLELPTH